MNGAVHIQRGEQARVPLNVAIVGGGKACYNLLQLLDEERLKRLKMRILGVSDVNAEAQGLLYAKSLHVFTTTDLKDLFSLAGLNLIVELTGSAKVRELIYETKPPGISVIDHRATRLLWDLIQMEVEKTEIERERQKERQESKDRTQVILDSLPYRVMVVQMDKIIETVNLKFLKDFGLNYEEVVGRHCYEARYGLDEPCGSYGRSCFMTDRLDEIREKGLISTYQEYIDENGETRFDVITIGPVYNDKGEVIKLVEVSRDVTERLRLEREVEKSNTFFEKVIQSTVDGIVVVDTKGKVLIFNEGMERLTGYCASEIINKGHLSTFYNIDVAKENMRKMRSDQYGPPGKLNPTSMTITTKDEREIPVTLSASLISIDGKEVGSVGVFRDMREILKMRKELEDANIQLIQSQKIASIGRMAAGVAHEINNPLSAIVMFAELLKDNLQDQSRGLKDVQEIVDQALRCKKIVSDLLEFSRKSAGKTSAFSLEDLLNKSLNLLINKAEFQNIRILKEIAPDMPTLLGDMGQLIQVFANLIMNAADAMEGRGTLKVKALLDKARSRFITELADTGPGIPEELRDKVFDIFFTTKPVGKGTGLGLSISQNIIRLHGGEISFRCPPEGGTVFTVELPLKHAEARNGNDSVFMGEEAVFLGLDEP